MTSAPLIVLVPHSLGKEAAVARLKTKVLAAVKTFPLLVVEEETWVGDRMTFRVSALGQVARGIVDVLDDHVRVELVLPWALQTFAQRIQSTLQGRGKLLLEKK